MSQDTRESQILDSFYKTIAEAQRKQQAAQRIRVLDARREEIQAASLRESRQPPRKRRGEVWAAHFGTSTKGACYCCKKHLDVFDTWETGHIIAHSRGGTIAVDNLRPVCGPCNTSMGDENMDEFMLRSKAADLLPTP
jgi:5-methylcytosine-specific restriction endonuclease McrA